MTDPSMPFRAPAASARIRWRLPAALAFALIAAGASGQQATPATAPSIAPYFQPATAVPRAPDADGFLHRWWLLDPVSKPNRSNTGFTATYVRGALNPATYPGDVTTLPRDGQVVQAGAPLRWRALDAVPFDVKLFDLAKGLGKSTYGVVFWAVTVVDAPREMRDVRMAVGSNSASVWWLNGREAVGLFDDRRMVMDDVLSDRLTLRKGRNVIRGAVINGPGVSAFCVRFLGPDGKPVTDLATVLR